MIIGRENEQRELCVERKIKKGPFLCGNEAFFLPRFFFSSLALAYTAFSL